jgi:hypothetical protein
LPYERGCSLPTTPPAAGIFEREVVAVMGEFRTVEFESEE